MFFVYIFLQTHRFSVGLPYTHLKKHSTKSCYCGNITIIIIIRSQSDQTIGHLICRGCLLLSRYVFDGRRMQRSITIRVDVISLNRPNNTHTHTQTHTYSPLPLPAALDLGICSLSYISESIEKHAQQPRDKPHQTYHQTKYAITQYTNTHVT